MDRTDALIFTVCLVVYVAGVFVGGAMAYTITDRHWQDWAIKNEYTHYDRKTDELVLHELEEVESNE